MYAIDNKLFTGLLIRWSLVQIQYGSPFLFTLHTRKPHACSLVDCARCAQPHADTCGWSFAVHRSFRWVPRSLTAATIIFRSLPARPSPVRLTIFSNTVRKIPRRSQRRSRAPSQLQMRIYLRSPPTKAQRSAWHHFPQSFPCCL